MRLNLSISRLFQILVIPHQHLLDLTHVHGVIVALRITLVDGFLIDDATWLDFCGIDLLADEYQLGFLEIDSVIGIDGCESSLGYLILILSSSRPDVLPR